ncbi:MAG: sodium:solute symporter family transporter, partial [Anaerovoracaceae bacterium]
MGPWASAFSYGTAYFSAVIFVGYAGLLGWKLGAASVWIGIGNAVFGALLAWIILAKPTRRMTHRLKASTMPEFFSQRFDSKYLKVYSSIIIFIFLVPYAAGVYRGLGALFAAIFPSVPEVVSMLLVAVLTAVGLFLGGYKATSMID